MIEYVLEMDDVQRVHGRGEAAVHALRGVSLGLLPGELVAIMGPAARMPLSLRLAMRDAARHRHRTGPATRAIAVAVSGSVVLAFLFVGNLRAEELRYAPRCRRRCWQ